MLQAYIVHEQCQPWLGCHCDEDDADPVGTCLAEAVVIPTY